MPIKPKCDKCGKELDEFGGILLGPPDEDSNVKKYHLCIDCHKKIIDTFS
jgi:DNA-directed RNA polymerase subunit RPC12/RpoP